MLVDVGWCWWNQHQRVSNTGTILLGCFFVEAPAHGWRKIGDLGLVGRASRSQLIRMAFQGPFSAKVFDFKRAVAARPNKDHLPTVQGSIFHNIPLISTILLILPLSLPTRSHHLCWKKRCCYPFPLMPIAIATNTSKVVPPSHVCWFIAHLKSDFITTNPTL